MQLFRGVWYFLGCAAVDACRRVATYLRMQCKNIPATRKCGWCLTKPSTGWCSRYFFVGCARYLLARVSADVKIYSTGSGSQSSSFYEFVQFIVEVCFVQILRGMIVLGRFVGEARMAKNKNVPHVFLCEEERTYTPRRSQKQLRNRDGRALF